MGKQKGFFLALIAVLLLSLAFGACSSTTREAELRAWREAQRAEKANWRSQYKFIGPFHKGRAWAKQNGKWFHITLDGTPAYAARYDWVDDYFEDRAVVVQNGRSFHITLAGTPAYSEQYDWVGPYSEGRARVRQDGKEFYIDLNGKRIEE